VILQYGSTHAEPFIEINVQKRFEPAPQKSPFEIENEQHLTKTRQEERRSRKRQQKIGKNNPTRTLTKKRNRNETRQKSPITKIRNKKETQQLKG